MLHITFETTAHGGEREHIKIVKPGPLLERDARCAMAISTNHTWTYTGYLQSRGVGGTNTGTTVLDGLVRARELGEVVANHLRLDLNRVEDLHRATRPTSTFRPCRLYETPRERTHLAVVDTDDRADHLGDDDHVTEVGLHDRGLFVRGSLLLCLAELLDQTHGLALETALEPPAGTRMDDLCDKRGSMRDSCLRLISAAVNVPQRTGNRYMSAQIGHGGTGHTHLLVAEVQKLVELDTTVRERAERPPLLEVGGDLGVGNGGISLHIAPENAPSALPRLPSHTNIAATLTILRMSLAVLRRGLEGSLLSPGRLWDGV